MSQRLRRRAVVVSVVSAVILGVGAVSLPALAENTGGIAGHLTDDAAPVSGAFVTLYNTDFFFVGNTVTDASGAFAFPEVPVGDYKIEFNAGALTQWAFQKSFFFEADIISVADGQVTVVEETLRPHGTISGQVTFAPGVPAAGVSVSANPTGPGSSAFTITDGDGRYTLESVLVGNYRLEFRQPSGSPAQYAHGKLSFSTADVFAVTDGGTTTVDEELLPVGSLTGVLSDAEGAPVPNATVIATSVTAPDALVFGSTGTDGRYFMTAFTGDYTLAFRTTYGTQWATGRSTAAEADPITLVAEPINEHDETLAPLGTVAFTAEDSVTGAALTTYCISTDFSFECTETGTISVDLLPGRYRIFYFVPDGTGYLGDSTEVQVTSGATSSAVLLFTPGATVTATITDKQTYAPVENACLELVDVTQPNFLGTQVGSCTDASGTVTLSLVRPGTYKAFVWANDGVHGHQWVGQSGGVGEFENAKTLTIAVGGTATLSPRLDLAGGELSGTVTDELTGAPVTNGFVSLSSISSGLGGQEGVYPIIDGHYSITRLGPYQWTLLVAGFGYAYEWSGDSPTRAKAKTVKVKQGQPVTYDATLGLGTTVTGIVTGPGGAPLTNARITFFNADSRDEIAVDDVFDATVPGQYVAHVKGPQRVKIEYIVSSGGESFRAWLGGATFEAATTVQIPASGSLTVDIPTTPPAP